MEIIIILTSIVIAIVAISMVINKRESKKWTKPPKDDVITLVEGEPTIVSRRYNQSIEVDRTHSRLITRSEYEWEQQKKQRKQHGTN